MVDENKPIGSGGGNPFVKNDMYSSETSLSVAPSATLLIASKWTLSPLLRTRTVPLAGMYPLKVMVSVEPLPNDTVPEWSGAPSCTVRPRARSVPTTAGPLVAASETQVGRRWL